jgi:RHS repeat-associated protein
VWTASEENVYWGSRLVAKRIGVSAMGHFITDRLHSKGDGSAFYPYGESKTGAAGDDREQFATYTRDQSSGLDYADQRWYSSRLGTFTTVDPNLMNANPNRSSSWNSYAYTEGNPANETDNNGLMSDGCGTWWEGARDFGRCGGGGGSSIGCEMTRVGCIDWGNSGWALVLCVITDPTSSSFGSTGFCPSDTGDFQGKPVGGDPYEEKQPECFAQLKYRPVDDWRAKVVGGTHSFWWIQDKQGIRFIISAGPDSREDRKGLIGVWLIPGDSSPTSEDNKNKTTHFDSGFSAENCIWVEKMKKAIEELIKKNVKYEVQGPNSNSSARYIGAAGGFNPSMPPGAFGWSVPIP